MDASLRWHDKSEINNMAIIYETQQDFERDKLKEQSKNTYTKSLEQAVIGSGAFIVGLLIDEANPKKNNILWLASLALMVGGGVQGIRSMFTAGKAHSLQLEKDRLGPQTVIFPPDVPVASDMPVAGSNSEKACCAGNKCHNVKPTSLLEQAEKRLSELGRE